MMKIQLHLCAYNSSIHIDRSLRPNLSVINVFSWIQHVNYGYRYLCLDKSLIVSIAFENSTLDFDPKKVDSQIHTRYRSSYNKIPQTYCG